MKVSFCSTANNNVICNRNDFYETKKIHNLSENPLTTTNSQYNDLSYSYYPISFKRRLSEHKSWGATVDPTTKYVSFKLFAYPDATNVSANVIKQNSGEILVFNLENKGKGVFERKDIPSDKVQHGDSYFYTVEREIEGKKVIEKVSDPYAYNVKDGYSIIQDHSLYQWNDSEWFSKDNPNRISRLASAENNLKPVKAAKIYELHTQTLTQEGTYEAAMKELDRIASLGFNAIEILPVETTPFAFNWGYDGVDKFAPSPRMGEIDNLKSLIDYAHGVGLNVIMDVVPNHINDVTETLSKTGPYIEGRNGFGYAFNYAGEDSEKVRDYTVNMVLNWLENYHCDGIRLDSTHNMKSDTTMKLISAEVNYHKPDAFLIAEDKRSGLWAADKKTWKIRNPHDRALLSPLTQNEQCIGKNENQHSKMTDRITQGRTSLARIGTDSSWDFNFFRSLRDFLYTGQNVNKFSLAAFTSADKVKYLMSHDSVGNYSGTRLIPKLMALKLDLPNEVALDDKDIKRINPLKGDESLQAIKKQKSDLVGEKLAIMLQTGQLDKYSDVDNSVFTKEVLEPLGIKSTTTLTYYKIRDSFNQSFDINKMALAAVYSLPGPKMVFQGDENADLTPFRFFRHLDGEDIVFHDRKYILETEEKDQSGLYKEKGYKAGKEAFIDSKFGNIAYNEAGKKLMDSYAALTIDLNKLCDECPTLVSGQIQKPSDSVVEGKPEILAFHSVAEEEKSEIYSVCNFSDTSNGNIENVKFPRGTWVEVLNTDDKKYSGTGCINKNQVISDGTDTCSISLPPRTTAIFKKLS